MIAEPKIISVTLVISVLLDSEIPISVFAESKNSSPPTSIIIKDTIMDAMYSIRA